MVRSQVLRSSHNSQDQDPDLRALPGPYNNQDDPRKTLQLCSSPRHPHPLLPECLWGQGEEAGAEPEEPPGPRCAPSPSLAHSPQVLLPRRSPARTPEEARSPQMAVSCPSCSLWEKVE